MLGRGWVSMALDMKIVEMKKKTIKGLFFKWKRPAKNTLMVKNITRVDASVEEETSSDKGMVKSLKLSRAVEIFGVQRKSKK